MSAFGKSSELDIPLGERMLAVAQAARSDGYMVETRLGPRETSPNLFATIMRFLDHYHGTRGDHLTQLWNSLHTELHCWAQWVCDNSTQAASFDVVRRYAHNPLSLLTLERKPLTSATLGDDDAEVIRSLRLVQRENDPHAGRNHQQPQDRAATVERTGT